MCVKEVGPLAHKHEKNLILIFKIHLQKVSKIGFTCDKHTLYYTLSRPWTKSPDSYLNDDSASHNLEHFLSAGVRKRHNVFTICKRKDFSIKI